MASLATDEPEPGEAHVVTRGGRRERILPGKITDKVNELTGSSYGKILKKVNAFRIVQEVFTRVKSGMTTREIDDMVVDVCRTFSAKHPEYSVLAARFTVSNLQKSNARSFTEVYEHLARDPKTSRIAPGFLDLLRRPSASGTTLGEEIDRRLVYSRDFNNDAFAIQTMMRSYLFRDPATGELAELPQHAYMRVAVATRCLVPSPRDAKGAEASPGGVPIPDETLLMYALEEAFVMYDLLSRKKVSVATPQMANAGTTIPQLASCYQVTPDDSLESLYTVFKDMAMMSKTGGGVAFCLSRIRAKGDLITSSGGRSQGLGPYVVMQQANQAYANQGGNRKGAFAAYLDATHAELLTFIQLSLPKGELFELRKSADQLKFGLMVPDLLMRILAEELDVQKRVRDGEDVPEEELATAGDWHLFSPGVAKDPMLCDLYDERSIYHPDGPGGSFSDQYYRYIEAGLTSSVVKASVVFSRISEALGLQGIPYMLFKDTINRQSNLATPGTRGPNDEIVPGRTITCSNLCTEVIIPNKSTDGKPEEDLYSVCNLGAIPLPNYIEPDLTAPRGVRMDFAGIVASSRTIAINLDSVITLCHSPAPACRRSNDFFRAIAIGVIGLFDVFHEFGYACGSPEAIALDVAMHACIYYGACLASIELGAEKGNYGAYAEGKLAQGKLQPDLMVESGYQLPGWEARVEEATGGFLTAEMWGVVREAQRIKPDGTHGHCRFGYVTADMPTATSSNVIGGMTEGIDPPGALMYTRKTLAGEFVITNRRLVRDLEKLGLWNEDETSPMLEADEGSIQSWDGSGNRPAVPAEVRDLYRTAREIRQENLAVHAGARAMFLSQSQSLNTFWDRIEASKLCKYWLTAWMAGTGTGSYYCHSLSERGTQKTGVDRKLMGDKNKAAVPAGGDGGAAAAAPACAYRPGQAPDDCEACSV